MSNYQAPLTDMLFTLEHLCDIRSLAELEAFSSFDPDDLPALLKEAGRFTSEVFAPLNRTGDSQGSTRSSDGTISTPAGFAEAYEDYVQAGWGAAPFSVNFGGGGLPWAVGLALQEMLTASNLALSLCPMLTQGAIHALESHGSPSQQAEYLPKLVTGEWTATMLLTEPQAGSDLAALRTRAERAADGSYRLRGQKIFITWGEHDMSGNIIHLVLARTPEAPEGTRGISCFIVPKYVLDPDGSRGRHNDIYCASIEKKMGLHASPTCVMQIGESEGAVGYLIGEENAGMSYMFTMMNNARLGVGLEGVGVADRAYQHSLEFACERKQGRRPQTPAGDQTVIISHPDVRRMLMTQKAHTEAARSLCYFNAAIGDRAKYMTDAAERAHAQELCDLLIPLSKSWGSEVGEMAASLAMQIHGGMGYVEETGVAQYLRDVRVTSIYEGSNGIQAIDLVTRKLPMRSGAVVEKLLNRIVECAERLPEALKVMREPLLEAVVAARRCGEWLLAHPGDDSLAAAVPYQRLMSNLTGGWLLARSAGVASELLPAESGDEVDFLRAKQTTAEFFITQILPQATALESAITSGNGILYEIEADQMR